MAWFQLDVFILFQIFYWLGVVLFLIGFLKSLKDEGGIPATPTVILILIGVCFIWPIIILWAIGAYLLEKV